MQRALMMLSLQLRLEHPRALKPRAHLPNLPKETKGKSKGGKGKGNGGQRLFIQKGSESQRASSAAAVCLLFLWLHNLLIIPNVKVVS